MRIIFFNNINFVNIHNKFLNYLTYDTTHKSYPTLKIFLISILLPLLFRTT